MKQEYNRFPYFKWGEILTSESLNNGFNYNDEQTRLSRCYTAGYGIIEGLSYTFSSKALTLQPGVAITPDGHMVKIDEAIVFKYVVPNATKGYDYDLCTNKKENGATLIPNNIDSYVVVLSASMRTSPIMRCNEMSCDARTVKELVINVHLKKKGVGVSTCTCDIAPIHHIVRLKRMEGGIRNVNILEKRQRTLFTNNLNLINSGLLYLCKIINSGFIETNKVLAPLKCWNLLFDNAQHLAKGLYAFRETYSNNWHTNMKSFPIYYFQHLEIMSEAINECIAYYNHFATRYPLLPTTNALADNEIYLGTGVSSNNANSIRYRSIFCRYNDKELIQMARTLERLIKRVVLLCDTFMENNNFNDSLKLCWYDPNKPLGERPIPYFYRKKEQLEQYWSSPNLYGAFQAQSYWNAPIETAPANKSNERLFLEGIYRRDVSYVLNQLNNYINSHHLDITVERVEIVKKTLRSKNNHKGKNYANILNQGVANENNRKRFAEKDKDNPVVKSFSRLPGSWSSYVSCAANNTEMDYSLVKKLNEAFKDVSIDNYVNYLNLFPENRKTIRWSINKKGNKNNKVAAFMALKSYFEMSYGQQYDTAEYMQGHPNGSRILLFCFRGKVFFDANIRK